MNLADDRWRHAILTNGPRGMWRTLPGSHLQLMDERIRFDADGTGEMHLSSVMSGDTSRRFIWRATAHGVIECQPQDDVPEVDDEGRVVPADWFRIRYEIRQVATDAGSHWVLQERGTSGFWDLTAPIVPAG